MNNRRDHRASKSALFDSFEGIEEGGLRASSSYSSDISEHDNDKAIDSLKDRVVFLKRLTGDIHDEVLNHNRLLDRMGNDMDSSRGILSGTVDRFKMVFESRSGRKTCKLVGYFVLLFLVFYFLYRFIIYISSVTSIIYESIYISHSLPGSCGTSEAETNFKEALNCLYWRGSLDTIIGNCLDDASKHLHEERGRPGHIKRMLNEHCYDQ